MNLLPSHLPSFNVENLVKAWTVGRFDRHLGNSVLYSVAVLTTLARREKRVADQVEWHHEQRNIVVHLPLRILQESVPELLARVPGAGVDASSPVRSGSPTRVTHDVSNQEQIGAG